ncbi:hypothetical protein HDV06_005444 [Boothiomyces sp. JEL0866]|nr:hypothetical protein HDV06_005444 [Boothiomyces sp. JEL0866]
MHHQKGKAPPFDLRSVKTSYQGKTSKRLFDIPEAPTFHPTAKEFVDPMKYIQSIKDIGEKTGIVKIVPPEGWNPTFAIDSEVNEEKLWSDVSKDLGFVNSSGVTMALKNNYQKWIVPYEEFLELNSESVTLEENDVGDSKAQETPEKGLEEKEGRPRRSTRKTSNRNLNTGEVTTPKKEVSMKRMKQSPSKVEVVKKIEFPKGNEVCVKCSKTKLDGAIIICDECESAYHLTCLTQPLAEVPETTWLCKKCIVEHGNDYGFVDKPELRNLTEFQKYSDNFKDRWFKQKYEIPGHRVSEELCEKEFWRVISSPYEEVSVEYGADIHSSELGSAFPNIERFPLDKYSKCAWNLNNLAILPGSLFGNIPNDISGMMIPWVYVGMVFSTFCWHFEDHYTYSINYNHIGETKTWYGIPASSADKFEETMKAKVPELFESNPDLLFHLTTLLSPEVLVKNDVEVFAINQRPGDFVITFPRAYHAGFNHGFNICEAVNFAPLDWLPFGRDCVKLYAQFGKQPVFSHEELLLTTAQSRLDDNIAINILPELDAMIKEEKELRNYVLHELRIEMKLVPPIVFAEDKDQCLECKSFCFLSAVSCPNHPNVILCAKHAFAKVCSCQEKERVFQIRYTEEMLDNIRNVVSQYSEVPRQWKQKVIDLYKENSRPPLKDLIRLAKEGEKITSTYEAVHDFNIFVKACQKLCDDASKILQRSKRNSKFADSVHSLEDLEIMVDKFNRLPFEAPEAKAVEQLLTQAKKVEEEALELLARKVKNPKELKDFYEAGLLLNIEIPALKQIDIENRKQDWLRNYANLTDLHHVELEDVQRVLSVAKELNIQHTIVNDMEKLVDEGESWLSEANKLLKSSSATIQQINDMIEKSTLCPAVTKIVQKLTLQITQADKIIEHAKTFAQRPKIFTLKQLSELEPDDLDEIDELIEQAQVINTVIPGVNDLKYALNLADTWLIKIQKLLKLPDEESLDDWLKEFSYSLKKVVNDESTNCICVAYSGKGFMLKCSECNVLYHGSCLGLGKKDVGDDFLCPCCDIDIGYNPEKKVALEKLVKLANEVIHHHFHSEHSIELAKGIVELLEWEYSIKNYLSNSPSVEVLRGLLRRAYRLNVQLTINHKLESTIIAFTKPVCYCQTVYDEKKPMIECEKCKKWYHKSCAQFDGPDFVCDVCAPTPRSKKLKLGEKSDEVQKEALQGERKDVQSLSKAHLSNSTLVDELNPNRFIGTQPYKPNYRSSTEQSLGAQHTSEHPVEMKTWYVNSKPDQHVRKRSFVEHESPEKARKLVKRVDYSDSSIEDHGRDTDPYHRRTYTRSGEIAHPPQISPAVYYHRYHRKDSLPVSDRNRPIEISDGESNSEQVSASQIYRGDYPAMMPVPNYPPPNVYPAYPPYYVHSYYPSPYYNYDPHAHHGHP